MSRKKLLKKYLVVMLAALQISSVTAGCAANSSKADTTTTAVGEVTETQTEGQTESETQKETETTTEKETETTTEKETQTTTQQETTESPYQYEQGLYEFYQDDFMIGVALPSAIIKNEGKKLRASILDNFNSITCENEMKPDALLDKAVCQANLEECYTNPAVKFDSCMPAINFALENNLKIRLHTLVWHSQTPNWFFTEDYTDNGELVSRDVMLARMENYIRSVLEYFDTNYPELVYAVDVCNEAFDTGDGDEDGVRMKKNKWYDTVGADYYYQAFVFARKYAPDYMKLFYNDYGCMYKVDSILSHLEKAKEEGLIDGIGMQSHLSLNDDIKYKFLGAVKKFCEAGYELQITELDIGMDEKTEANIKRQGRKYKVLFSGLKELREEGYNITSVTIWGINDNNTWRAGEYPLLFDEKSNPKPAYGGAMLDDKIPAID